MVADGTGLCKVFAPDSRGAAREGLANAELQDRINRFNFSQTVDADKLRQYLGLVSGGFGETRSSTATSPTNPFANAATLAGIAGTLFGKQGIWPRGRLGGHVSEGGIKPDQRSAVNRAALAKVLTAALGQKLRAAQMARMRAGGAVAGKRVAGKQVPRLMPKPPHLRRTGFGGQAGLSGAADPRKKHAPRRYLKTVLSPSD